mmetsp:Transcript_26730/g.34724  ORF Transcript_26730/g.34724 Transcript_26730/m.34724 type:complete len:235 (+) Transcript_26730:221-925(+)
MMDFPQIPQQIDIPCSLFKAMQSLSPSQSDDIRSPLALLHPPNRRRSSLLIVEQSKSQNFQTWEYLRQKIADDVSSSKNVSKKIADDSMMNMGVYARVRNANKTEMNDPLCLDVVNEASIRITSAKEKVNDFNFDACFDGTADQSQVYEKIGVDIVSTGVQGFNTCLLAYGQTGSGKSYTMTGNKKNPGLIPRVCNGLFHSFDMLVADPSVGRDVSSVVVEVVYYEMWAPTRMF